MKYRVNHKTSLVYKAAMFVSASALAVATGVTALAWGPAENRPTYTMESPAPSVTFNSITNSERWGDERNFLVIKDITNEYKGDSSLNTIAKSGGFSDKAVLADQHFYMLKSIVHNNAAPNLNLVSNDTKFKINIDDSKKPVFDIQATISSSNCGADNKGNTGKPCSVWDDVFLEPAEGNNGKYDNYDLTFLVDTNRYFNNKRDFATKGFLLSNDVYSRVSNGALLGYEKMDGKFPGCFEYSGYAVSVIQARLVRPEMPDFDLTKTARVVEDSNSKSNSKNEDSNKKDSSNGSESSTAKSDDNMPKVVMAKAGDTVEYEVHYKNTSRSQQNGVEAHDYLPNGMTYEKDSTNVINKSHPDGVKLDEKSQAAFFRENGKFANIGSYKSGSEAMIRYRAKLPTDDKLKCGENRFENTVMLGVSNVRKIATSIVTVMKKCAKDNPKQPNNPNKPQQPQTGICKYNRNLKANDKKCVKPGAPRAGVKVATAAVSLVLFLGLASFITYRLVRANRRAKQSNK